MAISVTNLTTAGSATNATSYTTASISPGANALILAIILTTIPSTPPLSPTLSGNGLTWVEIIAVNYGTIASPLNRVSIWRAMGASPSAGAVTIDYSGVTQTGTSWSILQCTGVDTSGTDGSGAIVQSASNAINTSASFSVSLGSALASGNVPVVGLGTNTTSGVITQDTGWTELGTEEHTLPNVEISSAWKNASDDQSADVSHTVTTPSWGGVIVEVKAGAGAGAPTYPQLERGLRGVERGVVLGGIA